MTPKQRGKLVWMIAGIITDNYPNVVCTSYVANEIVREIEKERTK